MNTTKILIENVYEENDLYITVTISDLEVAFDSSCGRFLTMHREDLKDFNSALHFAYFSNEDEDLCTPYDIIKFAIGNNHVTFDKKNIYFWRYTSDKIVIPMDEVMDVFDALTPYA